MIKNLIVASGGRYGRVGDEGGNALRSRSLHFWQGPDDHGGRHLQIQRPQYVRSRHELPHPRGNPGGQTDSRPPHELQRTNPQREYRYSR